MTRAGVFGKTGGAYQEFKQPIKVYWHWLSLNLNCLVNWYKWERRIVLFLPLHFIGTMGNTGSAPGEVEGDCPCPVISYQVIKNCLHSLSLAVTYCSHYVSNFMVYLILRTILFGISGSTWISYNCQKWICCICPGSFSCNEWWRYALGSIKSLFAMKERI